MEINELIERFAQRGAAITEAEITERFGSAEFIGEADIDTLVAEMGGGSSGRKTRGGGKLSKSAPSTEPAAGQIQKVEGKRSQSVQLATAEPVSVAMPTLRAVRQMDEAEVLQWTTALKQMGDAMPLNAKQVKLTVALDARLKQVSKLSRAAADAISTSVEDFEQSRSEFGFAVADAITAIQATDAVMQIMTGADMDELIQSWESDDSLDQLIAGLNAA
ncbi:MAG: hypothetical protein KME07_06465 [Pegethrix bostrychoides GSE-TBD4-15B]|jgi:hypothetical protein|uniref:Uncharacterized protein n=1 Tax=Pegethrix bostrychoides GSE-TBD4-15B TaxID=2839662 RepID=A0A951P8U4_9CYAN|nr:hypothetical protein [Pegethrix bostrychoides GSE-TBD4-15B]